MMYDESCINIDNLSLKSDKINCKIISKYVGNEEEMKRKILEAREAERRKIARDIHDGPAQSLAAVLIKLSLLSMEPAAVADCQQLRQQLSELEDMVQESMNEMRRILFDLKPVRLDKQSLLTALEDYFVEIKANFGMVVKIEAAGQPQIYPFHMQTALFRLVQEAINNIRKHAGVSTAEIVLSESEERVEILIKDEGQGFDRDRELNKAAGYGIAGMQERVDLLGGTIEILSEPGAGTRVLIGIPLKGRRYSGEDKNINCR